MRLPADGNHVLDLLLYRLELRLDRAFRTGWRSRAAATVLSPFPSPLRRHASRAAARLVRRRLLRAPCSPPSISQTAEGVLDLDRSKRRWYVIPNNTVSSAIRVNVAGREPNGIVPPDALDEHLGRLTEWLGDVVNVDSGEPLVREIVRTSEVFRREPDDGLPDLLIEWNRSAPVERIWGPLTGTIELAYTGWRTGDHHRFGRLYALGPGITPGRFGAVDVAALAPTVCAALGVPLAGVDATAVADLLPRGHR